SSDRALGDFVQETKRCWSRRPVSSASATGESAAARSSSMPRGTFLAPAIRPLPNSAGSRTSRTSAPWSISGLASFGGSSLAVCRASPTRSLSPFATAQSLPAFGAPFHRAMLDAYTRVDRDATVRACEHGIEVELGDLGHLFAEAAQPQDELRQGFGIGRRGAAESGAKEPGLPRDNELLRVDIGQRRDAEPRSADELGLHAAWAEGDERAEDRILDDADEQLDALRHRLPDDR